MSDQQKSDDSDRLEHEPTRQELHEHIAKLEAALRGIQRWSDDTGTDLTDSGYDQWSALMPTGVSYPAEVHAAEIATNPPEDADGYNLDDSVSTSVRSAIDGCASAIQTLVLSFHPRRGYGGLERDLNRARQILKVSHNNLWLALVALKKVAKPDDPSKAVSLPDDIEQFLMAGERARATRALMERREISSEKAREIIGAWLFQKRQRK
jgi:hypothetical protein